MIPKDNDYQAVLQHVAYLRFTYRVFYWEDEIEKEGEDKIWIQSINGKDTVVRVLTHDGHDFSWPAG